MLVTYKMTIKNNKEYITDDDMFKILYIRYLKMVRVRLEKSETIYERVPRRYTKRLHYNIRNSGEQYYDAFVAILMSRKIFAFLDWKPYVKTINLMRLARRLRSDMDLDWSSYRYNNSPKFSSNDHRINVLWHLWERGMYFEDINLVPKSLLKFTRLYLYIEYYLDKLFEADYKQEQMAIFSESTKETYVNHYYRDRYGNYRYRRFSQSNNEPIEFDSHEFNVRNIQMPVTVGTTHTVFNYSDTGAVTTAIASIDGTGFDIYQTNNSATMSTASLTSGEYHDSSNNYVTWRATS